MSEASGAKVRIAGELDATNPARAQVARDLERMLEHMAGASYVCDECGYQSDNRDDVLIHAITEHGITDAGEVGSVEQIDGRLILRSGGETTTIDLDAWLADVLAGAELAARAHIAPDAAPDQDARALLRELLELYDGQHLAPPETFADYWRRVRALLGEEGGA
jgi:hypothetical protein